MIYAEAEKGIQHIRNEYGEIVFRMGLSHMMDVGMRHLTDENVAATIADIERCDGSHSFMTNNFQIEIVECAQKLAQFEVPYLLVYVQRKMDFDVGDCVFMSSFPQYLRYVIEDEYESTCDSGPVLDLMERSGMSYEEMNYIGCGWVEGLA